MVYELHSDLVSIWYYHQIETIYAGNRHSVINHNWNWCLNHSCCSWWVNLWISKVWVEWWVLVDLDKNFQVSKTVTLHIMAKINVTFWFLQMEQYTIKSGVNKWTMSGIWTNYQLFETIWYLRNITRSWLDSSLSGMDLNEDLITFLTARFNLSEISITWWQLSPQCK